jgi:predicted MFS family arabinose efflux permease
VVARQQPDGQCDHHAAEHDVDQEDGAPAEPEHVGVDIRGALLLASAMLGLLYGLIDGPAHGWSARPLSAVALGAVFFALFARRQVTAATPLIRPSLFANRGFTSGLVLGLVFHAGVAGMLLVLSLFLQNELGRTPSGASLGLAPIAVGIVIASIAAQRVVARLGRNVVLLGLALTAAGILTLLVLIHTGETAALVLPVLVTGMGLGTCFGTIYEITLGDVDPAESGSASGSFSAVQQLAGSLGVATITTIYFQTPDGAVLSLAVVAALTLASCGLVRLMPRHARNLEVPVGGT